jgi:hypothetical protein
MKTAERSNQTVKQAAENPPRLDAATKLAIERTRVAYEEQ